MASVDISADTLANISADSRPTNVYILGDALVDYRSIYRSTIDCQPIVNQYISRLLAYMSIGIMDSYVRAFW